jgi:hypothetical protein
MKEDVLFCSYEIHCTEMFQIVYLMSLESFRGGWVHGLDSMTFGLGVQIPLNLVHQDLSHNTKGTFQSSGIFNYDLI